MNDRQEAFRAEKQHLADTQAFIRQELGRQEQHLTRRRQSLMEARRDMYENTVHFSNDFARMTEINQHLTELNSQTNTVLRHDNTLAAALKDRPRRGHLGFQELSRGQIPHVMIRNARIKALD